jgi:hypothetical protein
MGATMRRREFIKAAVGSVASWPLATRAQEPGRTYRLGCLLLIPPGELSIDPEADERLGRVTGWVGAS